MNKKKSIIIGSFSALIIAIIAVLMVYTAIKKCRYKYFFHY